jgi:GGDEF domain-containing protein
MRRETAILAGGCCSRRRPVYTASLGVAGYPDHASTLERLERLADAALYVVAERSGRNRVELADPANEMRVPDEVVTTNGSR